MTKITAEQYIGGNRPASDVSKNSNGKITVRTVRKARQGMPAALGRIQAYLDEKDQGAA